MSQPPVTEDISLTGKADDQLFFCTPFFMDLDGTAINKVDPFNQISFPEDHLSFFEMQGFPVGLDSRYPFRQTSLAYKAAGKVTIMIVFLHVYDLSNAAAILGL